MAERTSFIGKADVDMIGFVPREFHTKVGKSGRERAWGSIGVTRKVGEKERTDYINITAFGAAVEVLKTARKGDALKLRGSLNTFTKRGEQYPQTGVTIFEVEKISRERRAEEDDDDDFEDFMDNDRPAF